jgi:hypothetical protein
VNVATKCKLQADADSWETKFKELTENNAMMEQMMQHEKSKHIRLEAKVKNLESLRVNQKKLGAPPKGPIKKSNWQESSSKAHPQEFTSLSCKSRASQSRQCQQRIKCRTTKEAQALFSSLVSNEQEQDFNQTTNKVGCAAELVHHQYGLKPDLSVTPFHNTIRLHNSNILHKLPMPSNLAFHDLTPTKCAPHAAKSLLGLGSKFIPTPKFTTCDKMMEASVGRFEHDFFVKVIFAADESESNALAWADQDTYHPKLYVKSKVEHRTCTP